MKRRLTLVFFGAIALTGLIAVGVSASTLATVPVLAETIDANQADVPPGMIAVFLPRAGDGFSDGGDGYSDGGDGYSDGGDGPGGLEWVLASRLPDGFADGGDVPDGFVALMAQPVGEEFWRDGVGPEGMLPVLAWAWQAPDGFADGGDLPVGWVPVLFPTIEVQGLGP
jgi:hypothetical protein